MDKTEGVGRVMKIIKKKFGMLAGKEPTQESAIEIYNLFNPKEKRDENAKRQRTIKAERKGGEDQRRAVSAGGQAAQGRSDSGYSGGGLAS